MDNKRLLSAVGAFFKKLLTENIPLKLIALLFAVLLWGYVLTIENPEYAKVVRDVEITMVGEEALTEKGLMLVSRELGVTDVTVLCKIGKHSELDASRVSCVVDLASRAISLTEDEDSKIIPLPVSTTLDSGYGTVTEVDTSFVEVEVARVSTRRNLPVAIEFSGTLPDGFRLTRPDRLTITVSGRKSLVDEIARAVVTVDLNEFPINDPETLAGEYTPVCPVRFYNSGNIGLENIVADNGESYSLEVPLTIRASRELPIVPDIRIGDRYTYAATQSRETVLVFGEWSELVRLDSISTQPVHALPYMNSTDVTAKLLLPDGISIGTGESAYITVTLTVEEVVDTVEYEVPLAITGLGDDLLRGEDFPTAAKIRVRGTLTQLEQFSTAYVIVTADLTGFGEGTHDVPLQLTTLPRADGLQVELVDLTIPVTLVQKPQTADASADAGPTPRESL